MRRRGAFAAAAVVMAAALAGCTGEPETPQPSGPPAQTGAAPVRGTPPPLPGCDGLLAQYAPRTYASPEIEQNGRSDRLIGCTARGRYRGFNGTGFTLAGLTRPEDQSVRISPQPTLPAQQAEVDAYLVECRKGRKGTVLPRPAGDYQYAAACAATVGGEVTVDAGAVAAGLVATASVTVRFTGAAAAARDFAARTANDALKDFLSAG